MNDRVGYDRCADRSDERNEDNSNENSRFFTFGFFTIKKYKMYFMHRVMLKAKSERIACAQSASLPIFPIARKSFPANISVQLTIKVSCETEGPRPSCRRHFPSAANPTHKRDRVCIRTQYVKLHPRFIYRASFSFLDYVFAPLQRNARTPYRSLCEFRFQ